MLDPLDPLAIEACFPGALTGETEVTCPHCNSLLTVPVNDPLGQESYRCCKCGRSLQVNWGDGSVTGI